MHNQSVYVSDRVTVTSLSASLTEGTCGHGPLMPDRIKLKITV